MIQAKMVSHQRIYFYLKVFPLHYGNYSLPNKIYELQRKNATAKTSGLHVPFLI